MSTAAPATEAGWLTDPTGRHESRWWDGSEWTARVADNGRTSPDPLEAQPPAPGSSSALPADQTPDLEKQALATPESASESEPISSSPSKPKRKAASADSSSKRRITKWEQAAREGIKAGLKDFRKPLADLVKRDANEGDTRIIVTDFLADVLGYDKYEELSTEYRVRGEFADYGVRIDQQLVAFIEVKRAAQKLNQRHLRQVETYAVKEGLEWCILTNGQIWQVYHVEAATGQKTETTLVYQVDLLGEERSTDKEEKFFHLHRDALKRQTLSEVWQRKSATAPASLVEMLLSDAVIDELRKEVRRQSGYNPDNEDLVALLRTHVIRPDLL